MGSGPFRAAYAHVSLFQDFDLGDESTGAVVGVLEGSQAAERRQSLPRSPKRVGWLLRP